MIVNILDILVDTEKIVFVDKIIEQENYTFTSRVYEPSSKQERHYLRMYISFSVDHHLEFKFYEKNNFHGPISENFIKLINNIRISIFCGIDENNDIKYLTTSDLIDK